MKKILSNMSDVVHSQALPTKHDKKEAGEGARV